MGAVKNALDFNPRSPRGERLSLYETLFILVIFQSTLPAWGATDALFSYREDINIFQSTLPAWGAT